MTIINARGEHKLGPIKVTHTNAFPPRKGMKMCKVTAQHTELGKVTGGAMYHGECTDDVVSKATEKMLDKIRKGFV